jgi:cell division protein FtsB
VFLAISLVVAGGYLLFTDNGLRDVYRLKKEKAAIESRIAHLQEQKAEYEKKTELLSTDPVALEREIREQLKFVRDDEMVFVISEKPIAGAP